MLYQRNSELDAELERQDRALKFKQRMWRRELDDCEMQTESLAAANVQQNQALQAETEKFNQKQDQLRLYLLDLQEGLAKLQR